MANYTAADIKALREQTGAGMMDVKKALDEADGDRAKAIEILRVKGLKGLTQAVAAGATDADSLLASTLEDGKTVQELLDDANATIGEKIEVKRVSRLEGDNVVSYLHKTSPDLPAQIGVLVAIEGGDDQVGRDVAMHVAAFAPSVLTREEVPAETVENERRLAEATAKEEGKPEAALPKIVEGRVNGFFKENVLLEQAFAKDPKKTVGKVLDEAGATATGFARFRVGQ